RLEILARRTEKRLGGRRRFIQLAVQLDVRQHRGVRFGIALGRLRLVGAQRPGDRDNGYDDEEAIATRQHFKSPLIAWEKVSGTFSLEFQTPFPSAREGAGRCGK